MRSLIPNVAMLMSPIVIHISAMLTPNGIVLPSCPTDGMPLLVQRTTPLQPFFLVWCFRDSIDVFNHPRSYKTSWTFHVEHCSWSLHQHVVCSLRTTLLLDSEIFPSPKCSIVQANHTYLKSTPHGQIKYVYLHYESNVSLKNIRNYPELV